MTLPPSVTYLLSLSSPSIPLTCHYPLLQRTGPHYSTCLTFSLCVFLALSPMDLLIPASQKNAGPPYMPCGFRSFHLSSKVTALRIPSQGPGHPVIHLHSTEHTLSSVRTMLVCFLSATSERPQGAPRTETGILSNSSHPSDCQRAHGSSSRGTLLDAG